MNLVIDKFIEILSTSPEPVLSASSLGAKKPSNSGAVPAIVLSLKFEAYKGNGIGRFIRSGDAVVKHTAIIEVRSTPETFSSDLKSLHIWPLPLKKNPASVEKDFTEKDLQLRNVTDASLSIDYHMVTEPIKKEEYKIDVPKGNIIFGEAQSEGEKIEMVHWTVTWRNEILGENYQGLINLEIWANSFNETYEISHRLQNKLKSSRYILRQKGFIQLKPDRLDPAENVQNNLPSGSSFSVWKQKLSYWFAFEYEDGGELSSGIPIKRIDVDIDKHINESLVIP
jgi:hypothetical protein